MSIFDIEPAQEVRASKKYSIQKADDIYQLLLTWTKTSVEEYLVADVNKMLKTAIDELATAAQVNFGSSNDKNETIESDGHFEIKINPFWKNLNGVSMIGDNQYDLDPEKVARIFHDKYYGRIKPVKTALGYVDTAIINKFSESDDPIADYLLVKGNAQKPIIGELKAAGYNVKLTDFQSQVLSKNNKIQKQISILL